MNIANKKLSRRYRNIAKKTKKWMKVLDRKVFVFLNIDYDWGGYNLGSAQMLIVYCAIQK